MRLCDGGTCLSYGGLPGELEKKIVFVDLRTERNSCIYSKRLIQVIIVIYVYVVLCTVKVYRIVGIFK